MNCSHGKVAITAIAAAVPRHAVGAAQFAADYGAAEVQRIARATGIESVRAARDLTTGDLCAAAAGRLLAHTDTDPCSIDALILATQTPDRLMPATSTLLQARLGLSEEAVTFDINHGCAGYVFGLYLAGALVESGQCRRVLLCTGDVTTKLLGPRDRSVRMVFGDAASATLLQRREQRSDFVLRTNGGGADQLTTPLRYGATDDGSLQAGFLRMDGAAIMGFALREVPRLVQDVLRLAGLSEDDVQLFALHQANGFMLRQLGRMLGVPPERLPVDVKAYGNTGPSSIPLLLSSAYGGSAAPGTTLLCGFGVGLTYGAAVVNLAGCRIARPVEVASGHAG